MTRIPPPAKRIDQDEVLRLRVEEHLSGAEIARRLGFTAPSIRRVLKQLGEPLRPRRRASDVRWGTRLRALWRSLRQRCMNPRDPLYPRYGALGVTVSVEWEDFWAFYDWAVASGYRPGLNLEIVGRSHRFAPRTCRWISAQQRMRRDGYPNGRSSARNVTAFGETKSAAEWASDQRCRVSADALRGRLRAGVPPEQAISLPPRSALPKDGRRVRAPSGPRKLLDWQKIVKLHRDSGLAPARIAERVGANESTIRHGLKARGEWQPREERGPHVERLRKTWENIRSRCEDESDRSYRYYGARGARLCAEWADFWTFHRWAIENGYQPGLCITRREGTRVYSARNCRWTTRTETTVHAHHPDASMPARWTVEAFGQRKGPTEWSRDSRCMVSPGSLLRRLRSGWRPEDAIATPPAGGGKTDFVGHPIRAFGVTKGVTHWSRDRRCKVSATTLAARIERGVPPEAAITTPPYELRARRRR